MDAHRSLHTLMARDDDARMGDGAGEKSLEERIRAFLERPEAVLYRHPQDEQLNDFLGRFTVTLRGMRAAPLQASGVLVRLGERFFVLTAGHVVQDVLRLPPFNGVPCVQILVSRSPNTALFPTARSGFRFDRERSIDYGYVEIPASDRVRLEANDQIFAGANRLRVVEPADLDGNDYYVVTGYPASRSKDLGVVDGVPRFAVSHTAYTTSLAGFHRVPLSGGQGADPSVRFVDLGMDKDEPILDRATPEQDIVFKGMDPMPGASGGGCWLGGVAPDPQAWETGRLKLLGTHAGHFDAVPPGRDKAYGFAREVLIGHHLRLIAEDYPNLRDEIYRLWPTLEEWPLHPPSAPRA